MIISSGGLRFFDNYHHAGDSQLPECWKNKEKL